MNLAHTGGTGVPPVTPPALVTASSLRRLHVLLVVAMALGSFGGWGAVYAGVGVFRWPLEILSTMLSSVMLVLLTRATVRASTNPMHIDWVALGIGGCLPVIRIFVEVLLVKRMARAVAAHVDDGAIVKRATTIITVRAVLSGVQVIMPTALFWFLPLTEWSVYATLGIGALVMVLLMAMATHVVVAPLVAQMEGAVPVKLGGAGNDEPVAISTVR